MREIHAVMIGKGRLHWPWRLMMFVETRLAIHLHYWPSEGRSSAWHGVSSRLNKCQIDAII